MDGPRSKVELFAAIRRDSRTEKLSIHELSRRYGVHRRLVREALTSPWPSVRKSMPPRASVLDPYKHLIDAILRSDLDAPRRTAAPSIRATIRGGCSGLVRGSVVELVLRVDEADGEYRRRGSRFESTADRAIDGAHRTVRRREVLVELPAQPLVAVELAPSTASGFAEVRRSFTGSPAVSAATIRTLRQVSSRSRIAALMGARSSSSSYSTVIARRMAGTSSSALLRRASAASLSPAVSSCGRQ